MAVTLPEPVRELVDGKNFATVATLDADGGPQTSVVWVGLDDGDLVFSATEDRLKVRNLRRDPRASVSITDAENPYRHTQLRGTVTITPTPGRRCRRRSATSTSARTRRRRATTSSG